MEKQTQTERQRYFIDPVKKGLPIKEHSFMYNLSKFNEIFLCELSQAPSG